MLHVINIPKALHPQEKHGYVYLIFDVLGFFFLFEQFIHLVR